jgi:hypothetical protein
LEPEPGRAEVPTNAFLLEVRKMNNGHYDVSVEDIRIGYMNGQYSREGATEELSDIGANVSVINDWDDELDYYQQND